MTRHARYRRAAVTLLLAVAAVFAAGSQVSAQADTAPTPIFGGGGGFGGGGAGGSW